MGIFSALLPHPEVREAMAKTITEAECSKLTVPAGFLHLSSWGLQASGLQTLPAAPSPASNHKDVPSAHWLQWGARQRTACRPQTAEHQAAVGSCRVLPPRSTCQALGLLVQTCQLWAALFNAGHSSGASGHCCRWHRYRHSHCRRKFLKTVLLQGHCWEVAAGNVART